MISDFLFGGEDFLVVTDVEVQVVEPQQPAPKDNESIGWWTQMKLMIMQINILIWMILTALVE